MAILTTAQIDVAKAWLNDFLVLSGAAKTDARPAGYGYMQGSYHASTLKPHAIAIMTEIKTRSFKDTDSDFDAFADTEFCVNLHATYPVRAKKADILARYVAWMCASCKIYWDDTIRFAEEIDHFKKTYLGAALWAANCFASQSDIKVKARASSTGVAGAPKDDYKLTGPRSKDARDLKSSVGEKTFAPDRYIFLLEGDPVGKGSCPAAFIRPLDSVGEKDSTNKVFVGTSWKAYRNCICFFPYLDDAEAFLSKVVDSGIAKDIVGFKITKKVCDPNGYFMIGTEFGTCWIPAHKLNESISEDLVEDKHDFDFDNFEIPDYPATDYIDDINTYRQPFYDID